MPSSFQNYKSLLFILIAQFFALHSIYLSYLSNRLQVSCYSSNVSCSYAAIFFLPSNISTALGLPVGYTYTLELPMWAKFQPCHSWTVFLCRFIWNSIFKSMFICRSICRFIVPGYAISRPSGVKSSSYSTCHLLPPNCPSEAALRLHCLSEGRRCAEWPMRDGRGRAEGTGPKKKRVQGMRNCVYKYMRLQAHSAVTLYIIQDIDKSIHSIMAN